MTEQRRKLSGSHVTIVVLVVALVFALAGVGMAGGSSSSITTCTKTRTQKMKIIASSAAAGCTARGKGTTDIWDNHASVVVPLQGQLAALQTDYNNLNSVTQYAFDQWAAATTQLATAQTDLQNELNFEGIGTHNVVVETSDGINGAPTSGSGWTMQISDAHGHVYNTCNDTYYCLGTVPAGQGVDVVLHAPPNSQASYTCPGGSTQNMVVNVQAQAYVGECTAPTFGRLYRVQMGAYNYG